MCIRDSYSLVMFHRIPYTEAVERGRVQGEILDRLLEGKEELTEVDLQLAARLVGDRLPEVSAIQLSALWASQKEPLMRLFSVSVPGLIFYWQSSRCVIFTTWSVRLAEPLGGASNM